MYLRFCLELTSDLLLAEFAVNRDVIDRHDGKRLTRGSSQSPEWIQSREQQWKVHLICKVDRPSQQRAHRGNYYK